MRSLYLLLLVALPFTQCGCLTGHVWEQTLAGRFEGGYVTGVADAAPGDPVQQPRVVLQYSYPVGWFGSHRLLVPIDADGQFPRPIGYVGPARGMSELQTMVRAVDWDRAAHYQFSPKDVDAFESANKAGQVRLRPDYYRGMTGIDLPWRARLFLIDSQGLAVSPDPFDESGRPLLRFDTDPTGRFPQGSRVLIIPKTQTMTSGEHAGQILIVTAVTPVLLIEDIVYTPVYWMLSSIKC